MRLYPQVGFSVARRTIRARRPAGIAGRPGRVGFVVQRRATSWRCQRRIVAGVTSSPRRRRTGSSRVRAAISARSAQRQPWARRASSEHGELVAQDEDLDVLGGVGSGAQHDPAHELGEHQVDQPQRHQRIMPGSCRGRTQQVMGVRTVSGTHRVSRVSQFLLIMSRRRPRLRGRPGFLAGWPAQGMGCEIWRR